MSLPPHFLDELRDRVTVSSVLGRKLKLERKGREFLALCPFHADSKPSLSIVDDKGFYHCFACGAHGDVFKFLMEGEGLKFMEAVEQVAALAGLEVPKATPEEQHRAERRRSLQEVVDLACRWYERQLHSSIGEPALRYLRERGLSDETIKGFRLGWAPNDRKALERAMKAEGVDLDTLVEAGLVKRFEARDGHEERAGETVDYMRGRVLFPITDRRGQVIAFGGRVLGDGQPKYLNSPDTPLFHKGRVLYGLAQAREPAHKSGDLLVAEGYMDVIALTQAGFPAVAPLGTALTEDQITELWRMVPEPILCFDGDTAGQRAARRACDRALPMLKPGHSLRFMTLPEGQDPDDLIKREGTKAMRTLIGTAIGLADFLWASELVASPTNTPERRAAFFKRMRDLVREVADQTVQQGYRDDLEMRIEALRRPATRGQGWDPRSRGQDWKRGGGRNPGRGGRWEPPPPPEPIGSRAARARVDAVLPRRQQQIILATFIHHPGLLDEFGEVLATLELEDHALDQLRRQVLDINADDPRLDAGGVRDHLVSLGYSDTVDGLLAADALQHAAFARHDASLVDARQGLAELLGRFASPLLREQLLDAQNEYGQTFSDASWRRMLSLQNTLKAILSASTLEDAT